jgi:hypothetical protein
MQLLLAFPSPKQRGGARAGAGRKRLPAGARHTSHRPRPRHRAAHPVHITMRAGLRSLRSQFVAPTVLGALRAANRPGFRVVHHSIQANHLHLIIEAHSAEMLSSGMRGLAVRLARRVNRLLFRRGRLCSSPSCSPRTSLSRMARRFPAHRRPKLPRQRSQGTRRGQKGAQSQRDAPKFAHFRVTGNTK